eukprot:m.1111124 g.1111124  ORF g.1111124 m.1111124 type:complete len:622 (+) comp24361_c0_seq20:217-2082(+)
MADKRKLQTEIDRCLKSVQERMDIFEDTWDKVQNAANSNQKDKYEGDLKKEIKKLQRLRDQIKTWLAGNDVKTQRNVLVETRRLIEVQMERFKVIERETKTKAFSKEGLAAATKISPREKEKNEIREWLNECVSELNLQVEQYEAEIESLSSSRKKRSKQSEKETMLSERITRHHFHVGKLEMLMRMIDNSAVEDLDRQIKESLEEEVTYYIKSHSDPDYMENEYLYDTFEEDFESLVDQVGSEVGTLPDKPSESSTDGDAGAAAEKEKEKKDREKKEREKKEREKELQAKRAAEQEAQQQQQQQQKKEQAAAPSTSKKSGSKTQAASHSHTSPTIMAAVAAGAMAPPMPAAVPPPATTQTKSFAALLATSVPPQPAAPTSPPSPTQQAQQPNAIAPSTDDKSDASDPPRGTAAAASPDDGAAANAGWTGPGSSSDGASAAAPPDVVRVSSSSSAQHVADSTSAADTEQLQRTLELLSLSMQHLPEAPSEPRIGGGPRGTVAPPQVMPYHNTPASYPAQAPPHFTQPAFFELLDPDTLFFIFYHLQGTYQQYLAARELKKQAWRFHKKYLTWFQRFEEPKVITDDFERGTYVYFDFESGWCQRKKSDFTFEYRFLEDQDLP